VQKEEAVYNMEHFLQGGGAGVLDGMEMDGWNKMLCMN
jgi:hypothetical protein